MEVPANRAPDDRHQGRLVQAGQLADTGEPGGVELGRGRRADAPEALHGETMQELALAVGRDDQQAVGLRLGAGHLGEALGTREADGDG